MLVDAAHAFGKMIEPTLIILCVAIGHRQAFRRKDTV